MARMTQWMWIPAALWLSEASYAMIGDVMTALAPLGLADPRTAFLFNWTGPWLNYISDNVMTIPNWMRVTSQSTALQRSDLIGQSFLAQVGSVVAMGVAIFWTAVRTRLAQ
jgi:hypothetical protein